MKIIFTISLLFCSLHFFCQEEWQIDFESPDSQTSRIWIDTISNPNNVWHIGAPNKTNFTSAYSVPNAIVTDTMNTVPPNDTSTFYLEHVIGIFNFDYSLQFRYRLDGDESDIAKIEVKSSNNLDWYDVLENNYWAEFFNDQLIPQFNGSFDGWQWCYLSLYEFKDAFNMQAGDSIAFRFSYITDSTDNQENGWMIDDLNMNENRISVKEFTKNNLLSIYPNPSSDIINLQTSQLSHDQSIIILNTLGETVLFIPEFKETSIDVSNFTNGLYYLKFEQSDVWSIEKFLVDR
jgi:hypothetical protein